MIDIDRIPVNKLEEYKEVLKIILSELKFHKNDAGFGNVRIPFKLFKDSGLSVAKAEAVLNKLDYVQIFNGKIKKEFKTIEALLGATNKRAAPDLKQDLSKYFFLNISNSNGIEKIAKRIDDRIKKLKEYKIEYKGRHIILNSKYVISTSQFNRYTEGWFQYICNNPQKNITLAEITANTKQGSKRARDNFHKFLNQIKFKNQLRELFFDCSKSVIKFYNPITEDNIGARGINLKELEKEIKKLKIIK
jgi:hypothetical protein